MSIIAETEPRCLGCYNSLGDSAEVADTTTTTTANYTGNTFRYMSSETSGTFDAVPASVSYLTGVLMIAIFILGLVENATVLFVYAKVPKLRKANMSFVIGLALSDTGQTVFNIPFVAFACFYRKWIFGHPGCLYIGFVTTWFGLSQISLLCVIALERYFVIVHQSRKLSASEARTVITIVSCFVYGAGWATGPLVGWSEYKLVAGEISCSLSWTLKDDLHLSYVLSLFTFVWFLPLSIIGFAYARIAILIYQEKGKRRSIRQKKKTTKERKVAVTVLLMVGAFVISWTPYSIVALMTAFGDMRDVSSGVYLVPAAFAKASIIWNPIIYIARHKEFRRAFRRTRSKLLRRLSIYTTNASSSSTKRHWDASPDGSTNTKSIISSQGDFDRISTESKHCQANLLNNGTSLQMNLLKDRSPVQVKLLKERSPVQVNSLKDRSPFQVNSLKDRSPVNVNSLNDRSSVKVNSLKDRSPVQINLLKDMSPDRSPEQVNLLKDRSPEQVNLLKDRSDVHVNLLKDRSAVQVNLLKDRSPVQVILLKDKSLTQVNLLKNAPPVPVNFDRSTTVAVHIETVPCCLDSRSGRDIDRYVLRESVIGKLQRSYSCEDFCTTKVMLKEYSALRSTSFKRFKLR